jgi:hypothetical protein
MGEQPFEVLKAGLAQLKKQIKARKDALSARLFNQDRISEDDEH